MPHVTLWKNVTHPFEVGDSIERQGFCNVWEGDLTPGYGAVEFAAAEEVFVLHNRDDRPTGQICPSASVGDVVQVDDLFLVCCRVGFRAISCPDGGDAHRPRTGVGCAFFARSREEYEDAEARAKTVAREIGLEVRI